LDYQSSARKWRPQNFEEVVGQEHVTTSLSNAVRLNKLAQAYLFSGIRGVGKTSLARILAKGANCKRQGAELPCNQCEPCREITEGRSVDVIEVDGASNTGVDDVRELRENVKYLPLKGRYKIYIIDEVHMLSNAAFNALLKTLEEPPPHLIFIMATTESHKIPATILSRCQHFAFRRMAASEIMAQLRRVVEARKVTLSERGLGLIARVAEGSMRDALSLLDQAISFGGESVTDEDLFTLLGRMDGVTFHRLLRAIHEKEASEALSVAQQIADQGCDLRQFLADWLERLRHVIVAQNIPEAGAWMDLPKEEVDEILAEAALFSLEEMQRLFALFVQLQRDIRNAPQPGLLFDVALMKAILLSDLKPVAQLIQRLDALAQAKTPEDLPAGKARVPDVPPNSPNPRPFPLRRKPQASVPSPPPKPPLQAKEGSAGWQQLLSAIKTERPNIGSYLAEGKLKHFDEKELCLAYPGSSAFLIPLIQKASSFDWLEAFIKKQLGHAVAVILVAEEAAPKAPPRPGSFSSRPELGAVSGLKKPDPGAGAAGEPSASRHPLVREALRVLGGKVIDTRRRPKEI